MLTFTIENFLTSQEVDYALNFREKIEDFNDNEGVYGKTVVTTGQQWLPNDSEFSKTNPRYDLINFLCFFHIIFCLKFILLVIS